MSEPHIVIDPNTPEALIESANYWNWRNAMKTPKELRALELTSLDADLNFTAMLWSLQRNRLNVSRYNRDNDTNMLSVARFKMNRANRAYVEAKQSLKNSLTS